jgi:nucleotide-binding universal stress UspA family protein
MFRKILIPTDLTDRHATTLEIVAGLAGAQGAEVTLLHVIELIHDLPREEEKAFYDRLERKAADHLEGLLAGLRRQQVTSRAAILFGERVPQTLSYAEQHGIDLIVLSSHAVDLTHPGGGWGTMSYQIGIAARCPVLLVK